MSEWQSNPNSLEPQSSAPGGGRPAAGIFGWLARGVPTLIVLLALGGLAAWGRHTGWKVPKFSSLMGVARAGKSDWCPAHNVPESECVECLPELLPRGKEYGWCKTHGIPECPLDHPDLAQVKGPPHFPSYDVTAALGLLDRPEDSRQCKLHQRRLQFASAAAVDKAGVDVEVVQEVPMTEFVGASGEVAYDQTRVARLSPRVPGSVWRVDKKVGDRVAEGEALTLVDAAEVGKAKAEFLQALAHFRLKKATAEGLQQAARAGAISERTRMETEAALNEARIRLLGAQQALANLGMPITAEELEGLPENQVAVHLQFLGLPKTVSDTLDPKTTPAGLIPVKSPLGGEVVAREVVAGEVVDTTKTLFVVADARRVTLTLNVRLEDARHLTLGQPVRFQADGGEEETAGTVSWISTAVDEKTRTVQVRADLPNPDGRLRAHTFGTGRIILREEKNAVAVPGEAVHWDGDCFIVFVRDKNYLDQGAPKVFHVRKVRPGAKDDRFTEILAGVLPGEVVASKGSAVLQAELLKDALGEG